MFGCFDGETKCLITVPNQTSGDSELRNQANGTVAAVISRQTETAVKIKEVPLGCRVQTRNPIRDETNYDPANAGFAGWKRISLEAHHTNGSVVDVEILRSQEWIEHNLLQVGKWFSFGLTDIDIDGRGFVRSIEDAPEVLPGEGAVVIGRFVTRQANNRVRVTLVNGTSIVGTANHPVWCVEEGGWIGLGEFEPGLNMSSREGAAEVKTVEILAETAPVYNLQIAGEHVYEITDLCLLVHNADWNCAQFLELRRIVVDEGIDKLGRNQRARYDELLNMVKNGYRGQLGAEAVRKIIGQAPKELLKKGGHLHHILAKLGRKKHQKAILEIQEKLWKDHGIDPFMSLDIFIFAPTKGVHTNRAIEYVIDSMETFLKRKRSDAAVLKKLKELGDEAQDGFKHLLKKNRR